jgi:putative ABC transport system permease protein
MRPLDLVLVAVVALRANLMRSLLTSLGIIIGVASVIVMVAVGEGARSEVERQIASLGTNVLQAQPGSSRVRGRWAGSGTRMPFSEGDLQALREGVGSIEAISGIITNVAPVVNGSTNWLSSVEGVSEGYLDVRNWGLVGGRFFGREENAGSSRVAVLGQTAAVQLFGDTDPVGTEIRIMNVPFEVIGVLDRKGQSTSGKDLDDVVLVPAAAARSRLSKPNKHVPRHVGNLVIKVADGESLDEAKADIEAALRKRRRSQPNGEDDFFVRDLADYNRARTATQQTLGLLLGATALISLLVGGIGIMNIMLVSVSERTREIGLRMAVGARRRDILRQFLTEAVVLSLIGGVAGILLGFLATVASAQWAGWPVLINPGMVAIALAAAAATGILFGFLPARRASLMSPMEALRTD